MKNQNIPNRSAAKSPSPFNISRRAFLQRCGLLAAATGLPLWFVERQQLMAAEPAKTPSPNDRPGIAQIGCGGMGQWDATNAGNFGNIVAVCDVDDSHAAESAAKCTVDGKVPKIYSDFRKVLERDDVHIIVNSTPDHWHTLINIAAAKAKKDIYSQKPLTLTIGEGRHVVNAVKENKIVLQTGTQQRSDQRFRLACELVRNNRIGKLKQARVWLPAGLRDGPFQSSPVPAGLNWDFWQGQAPAHDYVKERCHGNFRFWYEYSGGTMTDWGAHHNDIAYWAIGLLAPTKVESKHFSEPIVGGYNAFAEYEVNYTYENGVGLQINTTKDDSIYGQHLNPKGQANGIRFEGTDGWIWVNRDEITASDKQLLLTPLPDNALKLEVSNDHMGNFFDCVRSRRDPVAKVETGHRSASIGHLIIIALRTGRKLQWDPAKEVFTGDGASEANVHLARPQRAPYDYTFAG